MDQDLNGLRPYLKTAVSLQGLLRMESKVY